MLGRDRGGLLNPKDNFGLLNEKGYRIRNSPNNTTGIDTVLPTERAEIDLYTSLAATNVVNDVVQTPNFTRSTTAYVENNDGYLVQADAGEARFDGARRVKNLLTYPEAFDNAAWTKNRSSISANVITAPNGTLTADKLVEDTTATNTHRVFKAHTTSVGTYIFTVYLKAAERAWAYLRLDPGLDQEVFFDLENGVVGTTDAAYLSVSMTSAGGGWYRCSLTRVTTAASQNCVIGLTTADNTINYTGDGTSGIYIWGAQLEDATSALTQSATEYIPTTTTAVTGTTPYLESERWTINGASSVIRNVSYHGAMVDGVKYFATDVNGVAIPSSTLLGYRAESSRRNEVLRSQDFANAYWVKGHASDNVATLGTSPTGVLDANLYIEGGTTSELESSAITVTADKIYVGSFYIKRNAVVQWVMVSIESGAEITRAFFDIQNGAVGDLQQLGVTSIARGHGIEAIGNGWYRCYIVSSLGSGLTSATLSINSAASSNSSTRVAGAEYYVWGAQFENDVGDYRSPTSYIATTTAPSAPRSADVAYYLLSNNLTTNYTLSAKSIAREYETAGGAWPFCASLSDGTTSEVIGLRTNKEAGTDYRGYDGVTLGSSVAGDAFAQDVDTPITQVVTVGSGTSNNIDGATGGQALNIGSINPLVAMKRLNLFGANYVQSGYNGNVKNVRVWTSKFSDTQMLVVSAA